MAEKTVDNPLREGLRIQSTVEPCTVVLFGASGDLTKRKLIPALFSLWQKQLLSPGFSVIGYARTKMSHDEFRAAMRDAVLEFAETEFNQAAWDSFAEGLFYVAGAAQDDAAFQSLGQLLERIRVERGTAGNRIYYLSTPPSLYDPIIEQIGKFKMAKPAQGLSRIVLEKPFGRDLETALALNGKLEALFDEDQIYRVDHFLGKDTVQNIMVFRFSNGIFEPVWNRRYVDHVQITAAESIGVGSRAGYYEEAGALRDMIQNHILQLLALVGMDPPVSLEANAVRDEKVRVMRAIRPISHDQVEQCTVRGQYGPGVVDGKPAPGYRQEPGVNPESATETYASVKFVIDNWRWEGVPFYVRSGKRMPKREAEIAIEFKRVPHLLFGRSSETSIEPNQLVLRIQPDEGITLRLNAKVPDPRGIPETRIREVNMDFLYGSAFATNFPESYERILRDAMLGDSTLFARRDMVEIGWSLMQPIMDVWASKKPEDFPNYEAGSWGPDAADKLLERDGRRWRRP
ncbi:MAG TPA: glucose-6-phosphate dehydrogenase [Blastocatellia bacterium]|nr:glucose-6-phosphate dehydrogenase [Blastocatellia bacterium]